MAVVRATTASPEPSVGICVDVFRDAISKRVLYVEAGKDLVDLLLTFLTLPVGAALRALQQAPQEPTRTGAIFNVYDSVKQLEQSSMCVDKEVLLEQKAVCPAAAASLGLLGIDMAPAPTIASSAAEPSAGLDPSFDLCMEWFPEFEDLEEGDEADEVHASSTNMLHEEDDDKPTTEVVKNAGDLTSDNEVKSGGDGFVKTRLRYMVHYDLTIRPASAMNSFALLRKAASQDYS